MNLNFESNQEVPTAISWLKQAFFFLVFGLSAVTSFTFFQTYVGDLFSSLAGSLIGPIIAGLTGALVFEGGAVIWSQLKSKDADSVKQIQIANVGYILSLGGGLLVTAVYLILSSSLVRPYLNETALMVVSLIGTALIVIGISGSFFLASQYQNSGSRFVKAEHEAELRAKKQNASMIIAKESTNKTLERSLETINAGLPSMTDKAGRTLGENWLKGTFGSETETQAEEPPTGGENFRGQ